MTEEYFLEKTKEIPGELLGKTKFGRALSTIQDLKVRSEPFANDMYYKLKTRFSKPEPMNKLEVPTSVEPTIIKVSSLERMDLVPTAAYRAAEAAVSKYQSNVSERDKWGGLKGKFMGSKFKGVSDAALDALSATLVPPQLQQQGWLPNSQNG
jgi:hypothetical protein